MSKANADKVKPPVTITEGTADSNSSQKQNPQQKIGGPKLEVFTTANVKSGVKPYGPPISQGRSKPKPNPVASSSKKAMAAKQLPTASKLKEPRPLSSNTEKVHGKAVANQMQAFLTDPEIRRLGRRFSKLDQDSNGTISLTEFRSIPELHNNPLVDRVVEIFDVDKNGEVDFREFIHGMSQFIYSDNSVARQRFAFRIFDIDNDGYISPGELFQVLEVMCGTNLTELQIQQLIDHTFLMCDTDQDGKISFSEFCNATKHSDAHKRMIIDKVFL